MEENKNMNRHHRGFGRMGGPRRNWRKSKRF